jgi:hypothetical protein
LMGCLLGHAWAQVPRGKPMANSAPVRQTVRFIQEAVMWESLCIDEQSMVLLLVFPFSVFP